MSRPTHFGAFLRTGLPVECKLGAPSAAPRELRAHDAVARGIIRQPRRRADRSVMVVYSSGEARRGSMADQAVGLGFDETLEGGFAMAATDPYGGAKLGKAKGSSLTLRNHIAIASVEEFIADPEHSAVLHAQIDFAPATAAGPRSSRTQGRRAARSCARPPRGSLAAPRMGIAMSWTSMVMQDAAASEGPRRLACAPGPGSLAWIGGSDESLGSPALTHELLPHPGRAGSSPAGPPPFCRPASGVPGAFATRGLPRARSSRRGFSFGLSTGHLRGVLASRPLLILAPSLSLRR